jgi:hypothetical protein
MYNGGGWSAGFHSIAKLHAQIRTLYWQIAVFSRRIATEKIALPRIAIVRGPNLRAECQRPESAAGFVIRPESEGWQSAI